MAAQLRSARAVQQANLHAPGLPPAAILCVRRLHAPAPGSAPAPEWGDALNARLGEAARGAVRARPGVLIPAEADAVLFDDAAALLAALAADWVAGRVGACWWWRCLLPEATPAAMTALCVEQADALPAALAALEEQGQAAPFLAGLPEAAARQLLAALVVRFGLAELAAFALPAAPAPKESETGAPAAHPQTTAHALHPAQASPLPTPTRTLGEAVRTAPSIPAVRRAVRMIAQALAHAPAQARSRAFARAVTEVLHGGGEMDGERELDGDGAGRVPPGGAPGAEDTARPASLRDEAPAPGRDGARPRHGPPPEPGADAAVCAAPPPLPAPDEHALPAPAAPAPRARYVDAEAAEAAPLRTAYGGLFFLVNLFLARGLYPDFSAPLAPRLALDLYDLLALIGLELWGEALRADPLWPLLAELAGRDPDTPPGAAFTPPDGAPLDAWFGALWGGLRADLAAGLEIDAQELPALLHRRAALHLAPARLDLLFALEELAIAVRRAGLDRDPGWVPAAGRTIRFHFAAEPERAPMRAIHVATPL